MQDLDVLLMNLFLSLNIISLTWQWDKAFKNT